MSENSYEQIRNHVINYFAIEDQWFMRRTHPCFPALCWMFGCGTGTFSEAWDLAGQLDPDGALGGKLDDWKDWLTEMISEVAYQLYPSGRVPTCFSLNSRSHYDDVQRAIHRLYQRAHPKKPKPVRKRKPVRRQPVRRKAVKKRRARR